MSDTTPFGFGKFVPGFDFLQNLAKGASGNMAQMPNLSSWIAPTISIEDLDKRVQELKAVQFWLEQNSRALSATIQALEVQKMTLATLQGMNVSMGDVANAFKLQTTDSVRGSMQKMTESFAGAAQSMGAAAKPAPTPTSTPKAVPDVPVPPAAIPQPAAASAESKAPTSAVDPMQWWGALTQQFQQIAGTVLADVAKQASFDATQSAAKDALKTATKMATNMASKSVQSVQQATRAATSAASTLASAVPLPMSPPMPVVRAGAAGAAVTKPAPVKKTTAAKNTTVAKDTTAAKKPVAASKAAAPKATAPASKTTPRRPPAR